MHIRPVLRRETDTSGVTVSQSEKDNWITSEAAAERPAKKPYHKPAARFERVFETSALSCGKVVSTQSQCQHNKKSS